MSNNENKKGGLGWKLHVTILVIILAIFAVIIIKLNKWSHTTTVSIDKNLDPNEFATESLDLPFYIDRDVLAAHGTDDINKVVVMGDYYVTQKQDGLCILDILKEKCPNTEFTDITTDQGIIASTEYISDDRIPSGLFWAPFSLYYMVKSMCTRDYNNQEYNKYENGCLLCDTEEEADAYMAKFEAIDLNEYDTLLIMYTSSDFYMDRLLYNPNDELDITTYMGALRSTIRLLNDCYPHLRVIVSSPYITYSDVDGEIVLGTRLNYDNGTESEYVMREYTVCTEYCISFIDNYFNYITDKNYEKYVKYTSLTKEGIEAVGNHVAEFLNQ